MLLLIRRSLGFTSGLSIHLMLFVKTVANVTVKNYPFVECPYPPSDWESILDLIHLNESSSVAVLLR